MATTIPTREEIVRKVSDLIPSLRKQSLWAEENRRLHEETIEALADAGVFKLRRPKHFGGYEADTTHAHRGRGRAGPRVRLHRLGGVGVLDSDLDGRASSRTKSRKRSSPTPDTRICGTLSPTAMATPADGGIVVNGKWGFISGAHHAQWQEIIAILVPPDGEPYPMMALVPMSDLLVVDDWHTSGLRGTGSVSTFAKDLFVPQERVLPLPVVLSGPERVQAQRELADLPRPADAGRGGVLDRRDRRHGPGGHGRLPNRLPDRKITYTNYDSQREAPITHFQVAEAALKIDEAAFHAWRAGNLVDRKCEEGTEWKLEERARSARRRGQRDPAGQGGDRHPGHRQRRLVHLQGIPIQRIYRDIRRSTSTR